MNRSTKRSSLYERDGGGAYGIRTLPEPERNGDGGVLPPLLGSSKPSAVCRRVDGTDIGAELKRAQVTLYPSLRLPSSGRSTSTGVPMDSGE
jgi:hypothetical protein